ncbi:MAG: hypothetical protein Q4E57_10615 [Eubacteriales bacterium]|nr:hypothetical protein [Eubacteriales bacterium]
MDRIEFNLFNAAAAGEEYLLPWDGTDDMHNMAVAVKINDRELADILDELEGNEGRSGYGHMDPLTLLESLDGGFTIPEEDSLRFDEGDDPWNMMERVLKEEERKEYEGYILDLDSYYSTVLCCRDCGCIGCHDAAVKVVIKGDTVSRYFPDIRGWGSLAYHFNKAEYDQQVARLDGMITNRIV